MSFVSRNPPPISLLHLVVCVFVVLLLTCLSRAAPGPTYGSPAVLSSFSYPGGKLKPFDWRYIRVELPPWFSTMMIDIETSADIDKGSIGKGYEKSVPIICLRDGSPPLPDVSETSMKDLVLNLQFNGSTGTAQNLQVAAQCIPFQKTVTVKLTNEQISPGVLYLGFFNGLGPARTQSKMISRGTSYTFRVDLTIEGCLTSTMWGPFCNQSIDQLSCSQSNANTSTRNLLEYGMYHSRGSDGSKMYIRNIQNDPFDGYKSAGLKSNESTATEVITCSDSYETLCLGNGMSKIYSLEIVDMVFQLRIIATNIRLNQTPYNATKNDSEMVVMCYARHNALPLISINDHSGDLSNDPLIIQSPEVGQWYIAVHVINKRSENGEMQGELTNASVCFSFEWEVYGCPIGKAGSNCTWNKYTLQRVLKKSPLPFESYYWPIGASMKSTNFPVEPLLSNSSFGNNLDVAWTYFLLDIPRGAAGANMHVQLVSDAKVTYGIYARFGGIPSLGTWDYYFNGTSSNNGSMFLVLNDSSEGKVNFYILYAKEGTWTFGLKHLSDTSVKDRITMSFSLEGCPKRCSSQGTCRFAADESGLTFYSYCACDRNHGGFDCGVELVTHEGMTFRHDNYNTPSYMGHIWQSVSLIASNAAAFLPAFWALKQRAFAEWVLFTSSGVSSALYHACDVGTWCVLSFHVLQFMDFWLSFMAVVSTFVYMATIHEIYKRAIHTTVAILTALLAATGATRSENIMIIIAIGVLGLLVGWLIEFSTVNRFAHCSMGFPTDIIARWQNSRSWILNIIRKLRKRFRWHFVFLGFVVLSAAGISWKLESSRSYWIWHSIWHVTIYTSSFFFLCSTSVDDIQQVQREYQLTRQNSSPRDNSMENLESVRENGSQ